MLDARHLRETLTVAGLESWLDPLGGLIEDRLTNNRHGDFAAWCAAIRSLPDLSPVPGELRQANVGAPELDVSAEDVETIRGAFSALTPWRKGPFQIGPLKIDAEWQSNMKWDRIATAASPLDGRRVLDVGCGNGYYALRMRGAGARAVVGVDPMVLYVLQFLAVTRFMTPEPVLVLPLGMQELPQRAAFDTVFSMGVLYHQRAPIDHLRDLKSMLRSGGELVLETLILPDTEALSRTPPGRYARMRNVWHLPSATELTTWLARIGFIGGRVADATATTTAEQRTTAWMPFESLSESLNPEDETLTVEGWPAPLRAIVVCRAP